MSRLLLSVMLGAMGMVCLADDPPVPKKEAKKRTRPEYETRADHDPNGIGKFYMGREIAQVMGFQGAAWLERPEREKEEEPAKLIKALDLKPDMVVADIGAGIGLGRGRHVLHAQIVLACQTGLILHRRPENVPKEVGNP